MPGFCSHACTTICLLLSCVDMPGFCSHACTTICLLLSCVDTDVTESCAVCIDDVTIKKFQYYSGGFLVGFFRWCFLFFLNH